MKRQNDAPQRSSNALRGEGQKANRKQPTPTSSILPYLNGVCTSLATVAFGLAGLARERQTARVARMATDALQLANGAHRLAEDLAGLEESEVAA